MAVSKAVKIHEELLKKIEDFKNVLYKTSGQKFDDSKLIRMGLYMILDEFEDKGINGFSRTFWKNPKDYLNYRDAISRMGKDCENFIDTELT